MVDPESGNVLVTGGSGFIGTRLVDQILDDGGQVTNVDIAPPKKASHRSFWHDCDILDSAKLRAIFAEAQPQQVVHLAASTETESTRLADYRTNTEGTGNVLNAIEATPSVEQVVITSSQFVHYRADGPPASDTDFAPHTTYGQSKVISERKTRAADLEAAWTIVRPTNVWGPWHPRYPHEFWRVLREGRYVHPGRQPVTRSYGYVGNVVWQMQQILKASPEQVHEKVFYLGDRPIELLDYVNGFSRAIAGRKVRVVPRVLVRALALAGDLLASVGVTFPITSSRFRSMTEDDPAPMEPTLEAFGEPPHTLEEGIQETTAWLHQQGFFEDNLSGREKVAA